jgi:hypothetical protein
MSALHRRSVKNPPSTGNPAGRSQKTGPLLFAPIHKIPLKIPLVSLDPTPLFTPVNHAPNILHHHQSPPTPLFLVAPLCPF